MPVQIRSGNTFRNSLVLLTCVILVAIVPADLSAALLADVDNSGPPAIGTVVDLNAITLPDSYGNEQKLGAIAGSGTRVIAFIGTECPMAKLYGPRLRDLAKQFAARTESGPVVSFIGVCSNVQDSLTEVQAYTNRSGIEFPILMDSDQKLADLLGVTRTPEVVVLDDQAVIRYRGRIDDQYGVGVAKLAPTSKYLVDAVEQLIAGSEIRQPETKSTGCLIGRRRRPESRGEITYSRHIAPIFNQRCVECHRDGEIAPFSLTRYEETRGWEFMIAEVVRDERMPPWNANPDHGQFRNDARLTDEEKTLIRTWIENGSPEGDPKELPDAPTFTKGWRIPEPDLIIPVRSEPFEVPATGVVDYQYFQVDPGFTEDKYVIAAEARPGNTAVVHHIIAFLQLPGEKGISLGRMLIGYAPGTSPLVFSDDTAIRIPAGSKILFEMHYTPNGTAQSDLSQIAMKFVDGSKVRNEVVGLEALNERLTIPANAANHVITAQERFREDTTLLSLTPHMHLRGKAFRYEALYPDGTKEILLDVPRYDFNWQLRYEFSEPRLMPAGTVVTCIAAFDNSSDNPNNPDPDKDVRWGQQSWEEMMIGFFTGIRPLAR
ncbi:MAG: redoxin domain-containing protein [Planctomyces sp.]|nr:redoxin domain-containing protein [Planctomyces sp.]